MERTSDLPGGLLIRTCHYLDMFLIVYHLISSLYITIIVLRLANLNNPTGRLQAEPHEPPSKQPRVHAAVRPAADPISHAEGATGGTRLGGWLFVGAKKWEDCYIWLRIWYETWDVWNYTMCFKDDETWDVKWCKSLSFGWFSLSIQYIILKKQLWMS